MITEYSRPLNYIEFMSKYLNMNFLQKQSFDFYFDYYSEENLQYYLQYLTSGYKKGLLEKGIHIMSSEIINDNYCTLSLDLKDLVLYYSGHSLNNDKAAIKHAIIDLLTENKNSIKRELYPINTFLKTKKNIIVNEIELVATLKYPHGGVYERVALIEYGNHFDDSDFILNNKTSIEKFNINDF